MSPRFWRDYDPARRAMARDAAFMLMFSAMDDLQRGIMR
jgi:hypothetical protein